MNKYDNRIHSKYFCFTNSLKMLNCWSYSQIIMVAVECFLSKNCALRGTTSAYRWKQWCYHLHILIKNIPVPLLACQWLWFTFDETDLLLHGKENVHWGWSQLCFILGKDKKSCLLVAQRTTATWSGMPHLNLCFFPGYFFC